MAKRQVTFKQELVDQGQPKRQIVVAPPVMRKGFMLISVKVNKAIHKLPNLGNLGMEDMRSVIVNLNICLRVDIATDITAHN